MSSPAVPRVLVAERALRRARVAWRPPERVSLAEWLDKNFVPSETQHWRTLPFQRGIADAFEDPTLEEVTVLKSSRVGFTKLVVGYNCFRIATDPGCILVVQPSDDDARE